MTRPSEDKSGMLAYYLRVLERNFPAAEREYRFAPPRRFRFDFAWPAARLAVEVDGGQYAFRGGRHATDKDREKLNIAASMGWRVLRFSPQMLDADPVACIEQIRMALEVQA